MSGNHTRVNVAEVIDLYDRVFYAPAFADYLEHSDYLNLGYFEEDTVSQKEACGNLMERLLAFIPEKTGTILDVACGKGATAHYLLRHYRPEAITGINISDRQLESARQRVPGATFLLMDAVDLQFADASFDNILCVESAFHFDTRERFFREAHRVLKPGGRLVLADCLMHVEVERAGPTLTEANHVCDPDEYAGILRRTGFPYAQVVDVTEQCWRRHYHHIVGLFHEQYLRREITFDELRMCLDGTYRRVPCVAYYVLAWGMRD